MTAGLDPVLTASLSAVMDGQATAEDWARVQAAWARQPELREQWAAWHLAADGLRSADLLGLHRSPEAQLQALRLRQARSHAEAGPRQAWWAPLGVAAGFIALALGMVLWRPPAAEGPLVALSAVPTAPATGLDGLSFSQAAAGRGVMALAPAPSAEAADWSSAPPASSPSLASGTPP